MIHLIDSFVIIYQSKIKTKNVSTKSLSFGSSNFIIFNFKLSTTPHEKVIYLITELCFLTSKKHPL